MSKETVVLYFFQGEVGESIDFPNAFVIKTSGQITFGDFLANFPIRDPSLHYRFQVEDSKFGYTWKDIKSTTEALPSKANIVTAKILKLDTASCLKRKSNLRLKSGIKYSESSELAPAPVQSNKKEAPKPVKKETAPEPQRKPTPVSTTETRSKPSQPTPTQQSQSQETPRRTQSSVDTTPKVVVKEANLLDGDDQPTSPIKPVTEVRKAPVAISVEAPVAVSTPPPPPPEPIAPTPPPPPALSREELVAKREASVQEQVDSALREKRERDEAREKEEQELEEARSKYDRSLTAWATDNGKKRNVRTLLSTMHTVIWAGSRWKPIGLGDVLTPAQVKLAYRKAMLVVHTDRCSGLDVEKKFIGKRIFEAINEAYTEFLEKEDV